MTRAEHDKEWKYRYEERLSMILEDASYPGGQRPMTERDDLQARREAGEMMHELEKVWR